MKTKEDMIKKYGSNPDKWNWAYISYSYKLSEEFIREFKDKVCWYDISGYQKLSEDFIREFKDKVNWHNISAYQKLSEDFIREFKDKVNWHNISESQNLSEDFINEFKDKIDFPKLMQNKHCPLNIKVEHIRKNVTKEDPSKHSIEEIEEKKDTSLDDLKKLVGI